MTEMTARELAMKAAANACGIYPSDASIKAWGASYDVCRALDAAQKPADGRSAHDPHCPMASTTIRVGARCICEPAGPSAPALARKMAEDRLGLLRAVTQKPAAPQPADPVATVQEAMGKLPQNVTFAVLGKGLGALTPIGWIVVSSHEEMHALATILNALPALLELCERDNERYAEAGRMGRDIGYREGVIKGLEMAAEHDRIRAQGFREEAPLVRPESERRSCIAASLGSAEAHETQIARIRNGGPIDKGDAT